MTADNTNQELQLNLPGWRREFFDDEVHECRDFRSEVLAVRINRVNRHRLFRRIIQQQRHQITAFDRGRQGESRQAHNAQALQSEAQLRFTVADRDSALDLDLADLAVDAKRPAVQMSAITTEDTVVVRQILRPPWRRMRREIGRRRTNQAHIVADLARQGARIGQSAYADRDIDALLDDVD